MYDLKREKRMRFEENKMGSILVIRVLEGRIAVDNASRFKQDLINYVANPNQIVLLDLSAVIFIDSSGLGALIGCLKFIGVGSDLVLCGAREGVANLFQLTRMNKLFRMFAGQAEALAALA
jgi:anti-sigma B factor antagonist